MIVILRNQAEIDVFRLHHPDGYTVLDGDRGVGLIGDDADRARNMGADPNLWIEFALRIGPAVHAAMAQ